MKKIGIFGGTFNPIHRGHLNLAKEYFSRLNLDKMLIIPTYSPPHKQVLGLLSGEHRYNMVKLCFENEDREKFIPSDIEIKRQEASYTIVTLNQIKKMYPNDKLYLIMGSDMFLYFPNWYKYKEILNLAVICTAPRNYFDMDKLVNMKKELEDIGGEVILCDINVLPMSSTNIREQLLKGQDVSYNLPQNVYEYIKKYNLYKG